MAIKVRETTAADAAPVLPGADFADAWRIDGIKAGMDAPQVAARVFGKAPHWIAALMRMRNALVRPLGLKTRAARPARAMAIPGQTLAFPVLSAQPDRIVLGLDDKHLDFRVVVEMRPDQKSGLAAVTTTYVRTHNRGGRLYLAAVRPFHRVIVPALMRRAIAA